jgi:hypothetical protein
MSARLLPLLTVLLLAACATRPPVVSARQDGALGGVAFRISGAAAEPSVVEQLVAEGFQKRGLRPAAPGDRIDYVLQVTYADRARKVGAFVPNEGREPTWLERNDERWSLAKGTETLGVRLLEADSGRPAYEARASRSYRRPTGEADLKTLVDAVLQPIKVD